MRNVQFTEKAPSATCFDMPRRSAPSTKSHRYPASRTAFESRPTPSGARINGERGVWHVWLDETNFGATGNVAGKDRGQTGWRGRQSVADETGLAMHGRAVAGYGGWAGGRSVGTRVSRRAEPEIAPPLIRSPIKVGGAI